MSDQEALDLYVQAMREAMKTYPEGSIEVIWEADRLYAEWVQQGNEES